MIKLKIKYGNSQTDLRFPCTEKEMNAALERIHAEDVTPLELYVSEVVFPEELSYLQDRFVNLDEVNYLGKRMDSFFGDEEYQFYEAMKLEGFNTLPDLINLSFNLNRYPLIQDIGDMGKIGREYLLTVKGCLPADDALCNGGRVCVPPYCFKKIVNVHALALVLFQFQPQSLDLLCVFALLLFVAFGHFGKPGIVDLSRYIVLIEPFKEYIQLPVTGGQSVQLPLLADAWHFPPPLPSVRSWP